MRNIFRKSAKTNIGKGAKDNVVIQNSEMHLHMPTDYQASLNLRGPGPAIELIGRNAEMATFDSNFLTHKKVCVISGIGGVGKTEFVRAFVNERKESFARIGWFDFENSFRNTLLGTQGLVSDSKAAVDDSDGRYGEILGLLRQLSENDLLVFDNVSKVESTEDMNDILTLPCRVIFTTRDSLDEDRSRLWVYDMDFLSVEDCESLFAHYRRKETPEAERENLREVIRRAGQHTLVLELMAKTCMVAGKSVNELLKRLNKDGFNLAGLRETVRREGGKKDARLLEHVLLLYEIADMKAMGEEAEWLLANLSILPLQDFDIETLTNWLELPDRLLLNQLNQRGWVRITYEGTITMHAVIAEAIRTALKPDASSCKKLIRAVTNAISFKQSDPEIYKAKYLFCAEHLAMHIHEETTDIASLCARVALIQQSWGYYNGALENYLHTLTIREKVLGKEHPSTATTYNNLALLYQDQGDYENALKYYLLCLAIREKVLGKEHPDTATTYNNLAGLYQDQGDYENALKYYLLCLAIFEKVLGKEHPNTAITYCNLARLFLHINEKAQAMQYAEKSYSVFLIKLGEEHSNTKIAKELLENARR